MVGLEQPIRPQKGQIMVTEKVRPFLRYPLSYLRQTDEGSVMIGDSQQEGVLHTRAALPIAAAMADRIIRAFPLLGGLNVVRCWSALRVMSPDGFPVYDQSPAHPGAFALASHSGVTLAASNALVLAPLIAVGDLPRPDFDVFSGRRFHVPAVA
jgi:glycine/D-amino acid oxidase-like deaminating enzyme